MKQAATPTTIAAAAAAGPSGEVESAQWVVNSEVINDDDEYGDDDEYDIDYVVSSDPMAQHDASTSIDTDIKDTMPRSEEEEEEEEGGVQCLLREGRGGECFVSSVTPTQASDPQNNDLLVLGDDNDARNQNLTGDDFLDDSITDAPDQAVSDTNRLNLMMLLSTLSIVHDNNPNDPYNLNNNHGEEEDSSEDDDGEEEEEEEDEEEEEEVVSGGGDNYYTNWTAEI